MQIRRSGWQTADELQEAARRSARVGNEEMPDDIRWIRMLEVEQLGFVLAVVIANGATLVRLVLVPAPMRLTGRWNRWLPRALPRLSCPGHRPVATTSRSLAARIGVWETMWSATRPASRPTPPMSIDANE